MVSCLRVLKTFAVTQVSPVQVWNSSDASSKRRVSRAGSLVVTNDNQVLTRYLRYELPVAVLNLNSQALPADLSPYPAVFVMPSAVDQVPLELIPAGDIYRVVDTERES